MRPHVICHMMGPLDGELLVDRWSPSTGRSSQALVAEYDRVHEALEGDAWIAGRAVGEEFAEGRPHPPEPVPAVGRPVHVARPGAEEYAVLLDRHGKLHWNGPETYGAPLVMILGRDVPDAHLAELAADGISYVVSNGPEIDLGQTLDVLASAFGVRRLILEGGARTNAAFLKAGLVDEDQPAAVPGHRRPFGKPVPVRGRRGRTGRPRPAEPCLHRGPHGGRRRPSVSRRLRASVIRCANRGESHSTRRAIQVNVLKAAISLRPR